MRALDVGQGHEARQGAGQRKHVERGGGGGHAGADLHHRQHVGQAAIPGDARAAEVAAARNGREAPSVVHAAAPAQLHVGVRRAAARGAPPDEPGVGIGAVVQEHGRCGCGCGRGALIGNRHISIFWNNYKL